jgi:DNA-binding XRE family transcriptional regulator
MKPQEIKLRKKRKVSASKFRNEYGYTLEEMASILDVSITKIREWHWEGELEQMLKENGK